MFYIVIGILFVYIMVWSYKELEREERERERRAMEKYTIEDFLLDLATGNTDDNDK